MERTERETEELVAAVEGALQLLGVTDAAVLVKVGLAGSYSQTIELPVFGSFGSTC